jgi:3-deoxy-7-phosphoheptulonate synthase
MMVLREDRVTTRPLRVGDVVIGGERPVIIAGPCAVENRQQLLETATFIAALGVRLLRGGAFKPRTSPYSFQGLGKRGLELLAEAKEQTGLLIVTEVLDPRDVELVSAYADVLQIGSRNMHNYPLLREVGRGERPVLLKRGYMATVEEFLMAAEYVASEGNGSCMLCERGVRGFDAATRNVLDLAAVAAAKRKSPLPVVVDPSHGTGRRDLVLPMARAALAAGADALLVEVHPNPGKALSDGLQSLDFPEFEVLLAEIKAMEPWLIEWRRRAGD